MRYVIKIDIFIKIGWLIVIFFMAGYLKSVKIFGRERLLMKGFGGFILV
jgi:hypothetical protein